MHIKPKKSLGQNFLVDQNIQRKIICTCALKSSDIVLEIGSGRGELTRLIAQKVNRVYALEIDSRLCAVLEDRFKGCQNIKVIKQDILKFDLRKFFTGVYPKVKIIGNIPYYITSPVIEHLLEFKDIIDNIFITVQKEVAERITAPAGLKEYGSFSCFVQYYTQPQNIFLIKRTCFFPRPKVDSCFLRLETKKKTPLNLKEETALFKIIRLSFSQRRKTLRNSLKGVILPEKLEAFFQKYHLSRDIRPENLALQDFIKLIKI